MQYLLLIYEDEANWAEANPAEQERILDGYRRFTQLVKDSGEYVRADRLQTVDTATSVRVRHGKRMITDGPFAETREQLAGFYLVECADLDRAMDLAAQIPASEVGTVEVRPVFT